jgi:hypothetical protein
MIPIICQQFTLDPGLMQIHLVQNSTSATLEKKNPEYSLNLNLFNWCELYLLFT